MGVETRLVLFSPDSASGRAAADAAFRRIADLDSLMSDYRVDSELNVINAGAGGPALPVSADLATVLSAAIEVADRTAGTFDVTAGPLVMLWREARRTGRPPDDSALADAARLVDWRRLQLDLESRRVRLEVPGMRLDLGGIAKGFAAEAARNSLASHGISSCLVEIGGEIALGTAPPGTDGWSIAVGANPESRQTLILEKTVIATSGDAEQSIVIAGVRHSHVIEPATGLGTSRGVSATVIGPDGALADALATAATLLDAAGRQRLMSAYPAFTFIVETPDA